MKPENDIPEIPPGSTAEAFDNFRKAIMENGISGIIAVAGLITILWLVLMLILEFMGLGG